MGACTHGHLETGIGIALVRTWGQMREIKDNSLLSAVAVVPAGGAVGVDGGLSLTLKLDPRGGNGLLALPLHDR